MQHWERPTFACKCGICPITNLHMVRSAWVWCTRPNRLVYADQGTDPLNAAVQRQSRNVAKANSIVVLAGQFPCQLAVWRHISNPLVLFRTCDRRHHLLWTFFSLALPLATSARGLQETFCFQREFAQSQGIGSSGDDIHHQGQVRDLVHGTNASPSLSGLQLEQNLVCGRSGNSSAAGVKIVSALILRAGMYLADNVPEYWPTKMLA